MNPTENTGKTGVYRFFALACEDARSWQLDKLFRCAEERVAEIVRDGRGYAVRIWEEPSQEIAAPCRCAPGERWLCVACETALLSPADVEVGEHLANGILKRATSDRTVNVPDATRTDGGVCRTFIKDPVQNLWERTY